MPGLYGISSNANVSVGNTTGLYVGSGNVTILNSAGTLLNLLSNTGNVGFSLTGSGQRVQAGFNGTTLVNMSSLGLAGGGTIAGGAGGINLQPSGTGILQLSSQNGSNSVGVENSDVYVSTFNGSTHLWLFNTTGNLTIPGNINYANGVNILSTVASSYGNTNVAAYLAGNITTGNIASTANITASYYLGNGSLLTNLPTQAGTYSNTNVAAYLTTATINTTGNVTAGNLISNHFLYPNGVSILTGINGTYSNANVSAYLSSNISTAIGTTANVYAGNIIIPSTGTLYGNLIAANILVANIGIQQYTSYNSVGAPAYAEGVVWYDTVQHSLAYYNNVTNNEVNMGQELQFNVYNGTGSTINQGVPVYLTGGSVGTTPNVAPAIANTIATSQVAGVANQAIPAGTVGSLVTVGIVANVAMGSFSVGDTLYLSPYSAGQIQNTQPPTGFVVKIGTVVYNNSPNGIFLVNKTVPVANQYFGNLTLTGNLSANNVSVTNRITAGSMLSTGNITANTGAYFIGDGSLLTNLPAQAGTYSNANVASYLPIYSGNIQANYISVLGGGIAGNSSVGAVSLGNLTFADTNIMASFQTSANSYSYVAVQNSNAGTLSTADFAAYNDQASYMDMGINSSGYAGTGNFSLPGAGYIYTGNTDLSIGTYGANAIHFIVNNGATDAVTINANSAVTAAGNITAPNFLGTAQYWSGDLHGNIINDSVNFRSNTAAYPINAPNNTYLNGGLYWQQFSNKPVYLNGVLQTKSTGYNSSGSLITTAATTANLLIQNQSSVATGNTVNVIGTDTLMQVWPANVVYTNNDRQRTAISTLELYLGDAYWGANGVSASTALAPVSVAQQAIMNVEGTGYAAHVIGFNGQCDIRPMPAAGKFANIQYATGNFGQVQFSTTYGTAGQANVAYARAFAAGMSNGNAGNLVIQNGIGLHTVSGWAIATNKYVILNEDSGSVIQTNGNINVTGALNSTGVYTATALNAIVGTTGKFAAVSNGTGKNNGAMAYWDATNSRWSWFDTNLAVS